VVFQDKIIPIMKCVPARASVWVPGIMLVTDVHGIYGDVAPSTPRPACALNLCIFMHPCTCR